MEYQSAMRKKNILSFGAIYMDVEHSMPSQLSQTKTGIA